MASSSFTTHLGLCNWDASDRPKRADFVSDNNILDNAYELLNRAQVAFLTKENLYRLLRAPGGVTEKLSTIYSTYMDEGIREAITELLTAW